MSPQTDRFPAALGVKSFSVMVVEIYLDVLVVLNTYIAWILLSLVSALSHTRSKPLQRAAASFLGGLSSLAILIPQSGKLLSFTVVAIKIAACVFIPAVAFWRQSLRKCLTLSAAYLAANMLLYSALELIQRLLGIGKTVVISGFVYIGISPAALIILTAAIYLLTCTVSKIFSRRLGKSGSYRVEFRVGCKGYSLDGFADTGNTARDLFSGLPVIICTGVEIKSDGFIRAVPYKTISGEGILYAVNAEDIKVTDENGVSKEVTALVAGIAGGERRAVFDPKILTV